MQKLYLLRGLPGSGKSSLAKILKAQRFEHIEADMYHITEGRYEFKPDKAKEAHAWCRAATREALEFGEDVVVANTFTQLGELQPYLEMAEEFGIVPNIIHCESSFGSIHDVPAEVVGQMANRWETFEAP